MKKIVSLLLCAVTAVAVSGCGEADNASITNAVSKFQDLEQAYDEAAPFVAVSDDASVKLYETAGTVYRSAGRACDAEFDGYSKKDLEELVRKMDEQLRILDSLAQEPEKEVKPKKKADKNTYALRVQNDTQTPFYTIVLKSGSGDYDMPVALASELMPGAEVSVALQAPANEKFTVVATDESEKEIAFSGTFYLSDKAIIELLYEGEKYVMNIISDAEQQKTVAAAPEQAEQTEQTAE